MFRPGALAFFGAKIKLARALATLCIDYNKLPSVRVIYEVASVFALALSQPSEEGQSIWPKHGQSNKPVHKLVSENPSFLMAEPAEERLHHYYWLYIPALVSAICTSLHPAGVSHQVHVDTYYVLFLSIEQCIVRAPCVSIVHDVVEARYYVTIAELTNS